ncbi:SDR family oxidoreductase [Sorangium sp. So ce260]|uniref:SDR family oxidoreductase n=1 Tax=Sorangium sp. So ce260 TaxID=3133291 RepID=UPI003F6316B4
MAHDLSKRVALVTGASRGLGAGIARTLAASGARVAVNYFAGREGAGRVVEDIRRGGGEAEAFQADVRDEQEVARLVDEVRARFGPIEVLVLNATGPQPHVKLEELTWRHCLDQLEFFVKSPVLLAKAVVPGMKERRAGRIIQIGSEVFEQGVPEFSNYVSAKGAQLGLTRSWAVELGPHGITVNLVAPGWVPVERHLGEGANQAAMQGYAAGNPLRRMGTPDEIGDAVAFLASDAARFITGQKLSVNGGRTLA